MCAIAGRFNFRTGAPVDAAAVREMCRLQAHRGPDGEGVFANGPVALGHRRLAVIDLSDAGRQPMTSADGRFTITFNGEIYNFRELRVSLEREGFHFRSRTDTEVILAAYGRHGANCLAHLNGMFAFAIWDAHDRTLFLARDRLGKKPLYYRVDGNGIAFASEPKAFLAEADFQPAPNPVALSHYLSYQYVPAPLSAFQGVERVRPAHFIRVSASGVSSRRYWRLQYRPKNALHETEAAEQVLESVTAATRRRLISDVPLGAFLSGGIDSGAVVALMAEHGSGPVKTFSIGFDEERFNELDYARLVASRYGTDHHEFIVRPEASAIFEKLVWHYNEPFADASAIPTWYLSELTRGHVTVALNGDGGDESFAGYARYAPDAVATGYGLLPSAMRRSLAAVGSAVSADMVGNGTWPRVRRTMLRGTWPDDRRYAVRMMQVDPWLRQELLTPEFRQATGVSDPADLLVTLFAESDAPDHLDAMLSVDIGGYLPDALLVKVDIATMAHGLEGRSPLLDYHVMELAASLPSDLKRRNGMSKYIFRKAVGHLLPKATVARPKSGFSVPLEAWFRGPLREMTRDLLLDSTARQRRCFEPTVVERLLREHSTGVRTWHDQLWTMLMFEMWHRTFIDHRPGVPSAPSELATHAVES